jgi:phosphopantothenoylcysteine decarboxylase/phosphopantothenate--cysteine ligase
MAEFRMVLSRKKILVGITGGIAAYKIYELIRKLVKLNADVKVVITPSAKEFVTETTLRTLTRNNVYCEQFDVAEWKPEHISLADSSDLFIIAPASANTIGKIANGICDNLLTSLIAAFNKPVIIAPAMNCNMWENSFVQENINKLKKAGFMIVPPEAGELACGYSGTGRLANIDKIFEEVLEIFNKQQFLRGKTIVITAGGTKEPIDPVRYIGNHSSGKMGIALADAANESGAKVVLISTVKEDKPYKIVSVETANEMLNAVKREFPAAEALIMAAAVADFRVNTESEHKIKKTDEEKITLELVKNPDILKEISLIKKDNQLVIGFCAESEDLIANAKKKIESKKLDFIVANDIANKEIGFNSDNNEVTIIDKLMKEFKIEKTSKKEVAKKILERVFKF